MLIKVKKQNTKFSFSWVIKPSSLNKLSLQKELIPAVSLGIFPF